ncbi:hypothetical protein [Embleya hyalina]|nr:hypothetical protein [Embleya hyalina]
MGDHSKPEQPLDKGEPPPGNGDGRVPKPEDPKGKHKKDRQE